MKLTWRSRRQLKYLIFVLGTGFLLLALIYGVIWLRRPPECFSGPIGEAPANLPLCEEHLINPHQVKNLSRLWVRSFEIRPNLYTVAGIYRNPNSDIGSNSLEYAVNLYDLNNNLLATRSGRTFVNPAEELAIFESNISIEAGRVNRAEITFDPNTPWQEIESLVSPFRVIRRDFANFPQARLTAEITNLSVRTFRDISVIAILADREGNAISVSATWLERLTGGESQNIFFTWPESLAIEPATITFYPRINIFDQF